jgi:hypothetical protein
MKSSWWVPLAGSCAFQLHFWLDVRLEHSLPGLVHHQAHMNLESSSHKKNHLYQKIHTQLNCFLSLHWMTKLTLFHLIHCPIFSFVDRDKMGCVIDNEIGEGNVL